ncbi:MAG: hypothetical protein ACMG6S_08570 [Byssovorax sp.]
MMPTLSLEAAGKIAALLQDALTGAPAADGWKLQGVSARFLMGRHVPVAMFEREGSTLGFIVSPTIPGERAYRRSARFDIVYFSEDVADDQQQGVYDRHRAMIDSVAAWIIAWDRGGELPA